MRAILVEASKRSLRRAGSACLLFSFSLLEPLIERYDAAVFSLPEYAQNLRLPQRFLRPAINPFSTINKELRRVMLAAEVAYPRNVFPDSAFLGTTPAVGPINSLTKGKAP
jgi:hypothetical protein